MTWIKRIKTDVNFHQSKILVYILLHANLFQSNFGAFKH